MARIRTIKPEFPQSESMGRVSRDARLLFILLWPICDDHGRTRAASRMLASTLFPYDEDAGKRIEGWLAELEREGCIRRYMTGGSAYLEVCKWLIHQRIDKPSKPQFPAFGEDSETFREDSRGLQEPSPLEGKGKEGKGEEGKTPDRSPSGSRLPTDWAASPEQLAWARAERSDIDPAREAASFRDYWHGVAGAKGRKADWDATWRNWIRNSRGSGPPRAPGSAPYQPLPELKI